MKLESRRFHWPAWDPPPLLHIIPLSTLHSSTWFLDAWAGTKLGLFASATGLSRAWENNFFHFLWNHDSLYILCWLFHLQSHILCHSVWSGVEMCLKRKDCGKELGSFREALCKELCWVWPRVLGFASTVGAGHQKELPDRWSRASLLAYLSKTPSI